ncbi:hypothetical protein K438DRAFT_917539 [Mycena galopus ATCC 62051]|nr:hypothetical protein K438DRAFT_917539 [Mycena galopus ATCC 62051]
MFLSFLRSLACIPSNHADYDPLEAFEPSAWPIASYTRTVSPIMALPPELVHLIICFVDSTMLATCSLVCTRWMTHARHTYLPPIHIHVKRPSFRSPVRSTLEHHIRVPRTRNRTRRLDNRRFLDVPRPPKVHRGFPASQHSRTLRICAPSLAPCIPSGHSSRVQLLCSQSPSDSLPGPTGGLHLDVPAPGSIEIDAGERSLVNFGDFSEGTFRHHQIFVDWISTILYFSLGSLRPPPNLGSRLCAWIFHVQSP